MSPRVSTFLSAASRYQATVRHLAGSANIPSSFVSRNAPVCVEQQCQVCTFIREIEESVVMQTKCHHQRNNIWEGKTFIHHQMVYSNHNLKLIK